MRTLLTVSQAADLLQRDESTVRERIRKGKIVSQTIENAKGGGNGGVSYRIPLDALPIEAQIRYWEETGAAKIQALGREEDFDLGSYAKRAGEDGLRTLLDRQQAVLQMIGLKESGAEGLSQAREETAKAHGMSSMTLWRLEKRYLEQGLAGLVRSGRDDKGKSRSMCLEARRLIHDAYLGPNKLAANAVLDIVAAKARQLGASGCAHCPFNPESTEHWEKIASDEANWYPECDEAGNGIRPPKNRHAVNRVVAAIPEEITVYQREGGKAWRDRYMTKIERKKPDMVNECWFGDHHRFDLFVLDERGKAVRPWLTAWYDIGSGVLVGWCISTNPNSGTITEALIRAIGEKPNNPIWGAPNWIYIDNGMDYRSRRFEGEQETEYRRRRNPKLLNEMYLRLWKSSVVQALRIKVTHAQTYYGEAKPVERFFRTLEDRYCRQLPGYCGNSPEDRPENFERELKARVAAGDLMTMDEFAEVFQNQILPAYHAHPHSGYKNETPAERYARLPKARHERFSWAVLSEVREDREIRKVTAQGIKFRNRFYWDRELLHRAGETVTVCFSDCQMDSISVRTTTGEYLCEATPRELFAYVGEDSEKLAKHIALQKRQREEVLQGIAALGAKRPGKRANGNIYYEAVNEEAKGNISSLQAEKALRGRAASRREREAQDDWTEMDEMFLRRFREAVK